MAEWHALLDQLEIPDGAVAGLSASDKPVLRGKLLQLPAADRPLFFVGQPLDVLKTLRTLLPDAPSGKAQRLFNMISVAAPLCITVHHCYMLAPAFSLIPKKDLVINLCNTSSLCLPRQESKHATSANARIPGKGGTRCIWLRQCNQN